ncbi:MAG: glycosyltransferase [Ignavibacteriales bacterium]|nr:glycosyltransferase [Ignavibacteriales bacterium]
MTATSGPPQERTDFLRRINSKLSKESSPSVSLIVAFYNKWKELRLVIASLEAQTFQDFELIICDDGSRKDVVDEIHAWMARTSLRVQHLWQADAGFRKNRIMNRGIADARSDYLIFIDGDCVLHPEFVREHFTHREKMTVLAGRRLEFSPSISRMITEKRIKDGFLQKNLWWIIPAIAFHKDNNALKGVYLRNTWLRGILNRKQRGIVGCNFSVHKEDLLAVNGFDMRYEGPGTGEDSDLEHRLRLVGRKINSFCHTAVQFHLYHELLGRGDTNEQLFKELQSQAQPVTPYGIKQL